MKTLLGLLLFSFSCGIYAVECSRYDLEGEVIIQDKDLHLVLARGTRSELSFNIPRSLQGKLAPYIKHYVRAQVVITGVEVHRESKILKIEEIEDAIPDPLHAGAASTRKRLTKVKCP